MPLHSFVEKLEKGQSFSESEAREVVEALLLVEVRGIPEIQIEQLLRAWSAKGVAEDELVGAAKAMRDRAKQLPGLQPCQVLLDTCGTGGDGLQTPNISTLSALVVAASGVPVAKHGNRAATSQCGSADLLMQLGVNIDPGPAAVARCINEIGMGFLFAPSFHPAMKHVAAARRRLGIRTIFNFLGPLTNPAPVTHQLVGVADEAMLAPMARALQRLGRQRAWVVRGQDGLDEMSTGGPTTVFDVTPQSVKECLITPKEAGLRHEIAISELRLSHGEYKRVAEDVLDGRGNPFREAVLLNAGCALYLCGKAADVRRGVVLATESLDSGRADEVFQHLKTWTNVPQ